MGCKRKNEMASVGERNGQGGEKRLVWDVLREVMTGGSLEKILLTFAVK